MTVFTAIQDAMQSPVITGHGNRILNAFLLKRTASVRCFTLVKVLEHRPPPGVLVTKPSVSGVKVGIGFKVWLRFLVFIKAHSALVV